MLLGRKGHNVLLLDRASFPSDIPQGHLIHQHGPARLRRWGLIDKIEASNCPPINNVTTDFGDGPMTGYDLRRDEVGFAYAPRHIVIDRILVESAVEAGVEFRDNIMVDDVIEDDGRIAGIRAHDRRTGTTFEERGGITIGADGRHSRLAKRVGAAQIDGCGAVAEWYFTYFSGVGSNMLQGHVRDGAALFGFPTNDGLYGIFITWKKENAPKPNDPQLEARFLEVVDTVPGLGERVRAGRREEPIRGAADLPNFIRQSHGPGWALVGDASCHKDPFFALGFCDGFRDAEMLADALNVGFREPTLAEAALDAFEEQRNQVCMPGYQRNVWFAAFNPAPPPMVAARDSVRGNPEAVRAFYQAEETLVSNDGRFVFPDGEQADTSAAR
jgi:flavin-dependent dehydrogenase